MKRDIKVYKKYFSLCIWHFPNIFQSTYSASSHTEKKKFCLVYNYNLVCKATLAYRQCRVSTHLPLCGHYPKSLKMKNLQKSCKVSLTSSLSERAIFCCVTTVWGTTLIREPTDLGSGPGITGPGVKYGLKVLPTWGIPVRYGLVACWVHRGQKQRE